MTGGSFCSPCLQKRGSYLPENYQPISLTCEVCKTLKQIISTNIHSHLSRHSILIDQQHSFRSRRSCETQLISAINDSAETLNCSVQVDAIFLDISKAFDTVPLENYALKSLAMAFVVVHSSGLKTNYLADLNGWL